MTRRMWKESERERERKIEKGERESREIREIEKG